MAELHAVPDAPSDAEVKDQLLAHYATKPVNRMLQIDVFVDLDGGDYVLRPDDDGDCVSFGTTHELMSSPSRDLPVRVLIHEDADVDTARRALTKAIAVLGDSLSRMNDPVDFPDEGAVA